MADQVKMGEDEKEEEEDEEVEEDSNTTILSCRVLRGISFRKHLFSWLEYSND